MRIFENGSKINFVDDNNVFLGYDMDQCCCECADWFIVGVPSAVVMADEGKLREYPGYNFDTTYYMEKHPEDLDQGGIAIFRITNGTDEQFVHIYNSHNGYYGHGFTFDNGPERLRAGTL